jgi:hypothetical protein
MIAFVLGFFTRSILLFRITSAEFHSEDVAIDENLNKLTMSDDVGVEVSTTPTGRYNTNIQKQLTSGDGGVGTESSSLSEYENAQKYMVKKDKKCSPGSE